MREYTVSVEKLTDEEAMRRACECTFLGKSKQSLLSIYKSEHSPARTQIFWIELNNIPLASATHLLRHHVGSVPFQLTCRDDRAGGNQNVPGKCDRAIELLTESPVNIDKVIEILLDIKENSDRNTPVKLGLLINAQGLIDMSKMRICIQAHAETREIYATLKSKVSEVDPDLASQMVRKCVYRGGICGEPRCCGFNNTKPFVVELSSYLENFTEKQCGSMCKRLKIKKKDTGEERQLLIDFPEC